MAVTTEAEVAAQAAADRALPAEELGALVVQLNERLASINAEGEALGEQIRALVEQARVLMVEARAIDQRQHGIVVREKLQAMMFNGNYL